MKLPNLNSLRVLVALTLPAMAGAQDAEPIIPAAATTPVPAPSAPPVVAVVPVQPPPAGTIVLNFQGTPLDDVLTYLSDAAGFVILKTVPVTGTVNVVSRKPVTPEEAVDLLNAVLIDKGFTAIRSGRILKIVNRKNAQTFDLPVNMGSDPEKIPHKDEMVTQILPLRFGDPAKLIENLRPLLSADATISANEGSNSILMTDTQTNVRRIAKIIQAIDTSVSSISSVHVFPLQFADAKDLAATITQLFATSPANRGAQTQNQGGGRGGRGGFGGFGGGFGGGPGGGGGGQPAAATDARQAEMKVVAVADEQSNSLIVSAPDEAMPTIADLVTRIDTSITDVTETQIFRLQHADATELTDVLNNLYADTSGQVSQNARNNQGGRGGGQQQGQGGNAAAATGRSQRALLQSRVVSVPDPRTNSIVVSAAHDTMTQVAMTIGRLDSTDAKKQRVYYIPLGHADPENAAAILRGMFSGQTSSTSTTQGASSRLTQRQANGASADATSGVGGNSNTGGGTGGFGGR
ncbi:MAG: ral secretion pathway protein [Chthoniobacter sp.]|jgi:general secretion pathway protein D|nr:ral secretion pathway protein [Chthoniobacter sp.]